MISKLDMIRFCFLGWGYMGWPNWISLEYGGGTALGDVGIGDTCVLLLALFGL